MMRLDQRQSRELSKAFYDIGKLVFAIIILGQIAKDGEFDTITLLFGTLGFITLFVVATILNRDTYNDAK